MNNQNDISNFSIKNLEKQTGHFYALIFIELYYTYNINYWDYAVFSIEIDFLLLLTPQLKVTFQNSHLSSEKDFNLLLKLKRQSPNSFLSHLPQEKIYKIISPLLSKYKEYIICEPISLEVYYKRSWIYFYSFVYDVLEICESILRLDLDKNFIAFKVTGNNALKEEFFDSICYVIEKHFEFTEEKFNCH